MSDVPEKRLYSSHDARREFMEIIQSQLLLTHRYYMYREYDNCLLQLDYIYHSTRYLFSVEECALVEDVLFKLRKLLSKKEQKSYFKAKINELLISSIGVLHDTLHAHKLLLPVAFDKDDDDADNLLGEGGL
jgi:hypothetical protein